MKKVKVLFLVILAVCTLRFCIEGTSTYASDWDIVPKVERGDVDGDGSVNTDDAIYLLYNVMFGDEDYPVHQNCDFDGNGSTNTDDAIYLLYHVMFGEEDYPIACDHNYVSKVIEPNCLEQGYTLYTCDSCCDMYMDAYVPATGHSFGEWFETLAATCTEQGMERRDCANCDHYEEQSIAALGHAVVNHEAKEPTCTEIGWNAYETCERCDYSTYAAIAGTGHSYETIVTPPACTTQGYTTHICHCGEAYTDSYVAAVGHNFSAWYTVKAPGCEKTGKEKRDCICGHSETRELAATGHSYQETVFVPTCVEQGYTTHACFLCGDVYVDSYVAAKGHSYGGWYQTNAPGCENNGEEKRECYCGHSETHILLATGHNYHSVVTDATCTEQGYTTHTCENCGHSYVDTYIAATGHFYGAWYETKAPGCENKGEEKRDCSCGYSETRFIEPTGHNYSSIVTEATCTEPGYTQHNCAACGHTYTDAYVTRLPHNYVNGICEGCGKKYYSSGLIYQKYSQWSNVSTGVTVYNAAIITGYTGTDTEVYIPEYDGAYRVIGIDKEAFEKETEITKVVIPETVLFINPYAFNGCTKLETINIPSAVTSLSGHGIFKNCSSLNSIVIPNSVTKIGGDIFRGCSSLETVVLSNQLTEIPHYSFMDCSSLTAITIPSSVTKIGQYAFGNCFGLTAVDILGELETIDSCAFYYCTSLTAFAIPSSVTTIGSSTFQGCSSLQSIAIPESVTTIEYYAFRGCSSLITVTIPENVISIEEYVFDGCTSLTHVSLPNSLTSIGDYVFRYCTSLTSIGPVGSGASVEIPSTVTSIGKGSFYGCTSLTNITIPEKVTSIGYEAFFYCTSLTNITYEGTVEQWGAVNKGTRWNTLTQITEIACSNGTVKLN